MSSIWLRVRWLFFAFQDALRYQINLTGRPGFLISQLFIASFLNSFGLIFSLCIFIYLLLKGFLFQYQDFTSMQWFYSLALWVIFLILSRILFSRFKLGWMLSVDGFFRLGRRSSLKSAFYEGKEYRKFWRSAVKLASKAPRGMDRELVRNVEFYRLLIGREPSEISSWYDESIQKYYLDMKQRVGARQSSFFYASVLLLFWYVISAFFPMLNIFQQDPVQIVTTSNFNATNMLALSACLSAVYSFFKIRQVGSQQIHLQTYCLRVAENDVRAATENRDAILSLDRDTRFSLAGTLKGPLAMDCHLLLFPAILGLSLHFLTDFFAQIFTILTFYLLPSICRTIDQSRLFLKIQIVSQVQTKSSGKLMKSVFVILEILSLGLIVIFLLPYLTLIPSLSDHISYFFQTDMRFICSILTFSSATALLVWCKQASLSQREAYEFSFVLIMFVAGIGFAVLKGYFVAFIYSMPALGLVCLRLSTKMRRGY
tara:strand:- start:453 stop:1907 length:1455 start_codon:yes stop_codon:yes gene_type:complete